MQRSGHGFWHSPRVWLAVSLLAGLFVVYPDRNVSLTEVDASSSITAPTTVSATLNTFISIASSGTTPAISGFANGSTVQVTVSATNGAVKIATTTGLTAPTGYTSAQWTADNSTEISFYGSQTDVSNALGSLSYKATSSAATPTVSISAFLSGPAYNPSNGHFYEVVTVSSGTISWEEARCRAKYTNGRYKTSADARSSIASNDQCESTDSSSLTRRTLNGRKGYLANITSIEEHRFLGSKLSSTGWIGGADTETEGTWKWMDGPESGQTFWLDSLHVPSNFDANRRTNNTIDGRSMFNYWSSTAGVGFEPNNASSSEHYAEFGFGSSGEGKSWNDCQNGCNRTRYVIEYGETDDTVSAASATISVPVVTAPGAPTGLTAVAQDAQVVLSWTAPTDSGGDTISDYVIQYCVSSTCTTFADGTGTGTTATVTGLTNGTAYTFTVAAANSRGAGTTATSASVTPRGQLTNGSFENGTTGWTIVGAGSGAASRINLGVTSLGGCVSQDTQNYTTAHLRGTSTPLNDDPASITSYTAGSAVVSSIAGLSITAGTKALKLYNDAVATGYHVLHGPAAVSDLFSATNGQVITLDWYAVKVDDDFAILGYLLDTETCTQYEIIDRSGSTVSGWQSASVTIPATKSSYRFVFVNGTFDATGGEWSGAELYIDNISVGAPQTITFGTISEKNTSTLPFDLTATASSGLAVSYVSLTTPKCTVSGVTVTIVASGTCSIQASQSGGTNGGVLYAAAAAVTQSFNIAFRDTTAPSATWTSPASPQTSRSMSFSLAFDESVSGIASGDFSNVAASGAATGCTFAPSAASGSSITVSVTCSSDGNLVVRLASGSVVDASGNTGPTANRDSNEIAIDATVPSATWTSPVSPQTSRLLMFTLAFTESVSGIASGDFSNVAASGAATGCTFAPSAASGSSITVSVTCSSDGNLVVRLASGAVVDASGNTGPAANRDTATIEIDSLAPSGNWTSPASPQTSRSMSFSLAFDEPVSGIASGDFSNVAASGAATGCTFAPSAASGSSITVSVTCSSDGNLVVRLASGSVVDASGNTGPTANRDSEAIAIDATPPEAPQIPVLAASSDLGVDATDGITADTTPTIEVSGLEVGATAVVTATQSGLSSVTCTVSAGNCTLGTLADGVWTLTARQTDSAGNQSSQSPSLSITIDGTAPTVTLERASATSSTIGVTFRLVADEQVVCADLSTTAGDDFEWTNISTLLSIRQSDDQTCTIVALSRASMGGGPVSAQLDAAAGFSLLDIAGNAQTTLTGAPVAITVNIPAPPVVTTTTTTVEPAPTIPPTTVARRANRNNRTTTTTTPVNVAITTTSVATPTTQPQLLRPLAPPPSSTTSTTQAPMSGVTTAAPVTTSPAISVTVPPSLAPTDVVVILSDQRKQEMNVREIDNETVETSFDDTVLKLKAVNENDEPHSLLPNGSLLLTPGTFTKVEGEGMLPESEVEVWLYSTPRLLGTLLVNANGAFVGSLKVPTGIELGSHKIQVVGLSPEAETLTVALGVTVASPEVVSANNAGNLTVQQAELLVQPTVVSLSAMSDNASANVIMLLMVLFMLVSALVSAQPLGRRRTGSVIEMIMGITTWNAQAPALRLAMLGLGAIVGFVAATTTDFAVAAPSTALLIAWICLGVLDVAAGGVASVAFSLSVLAAGGVGTAWDLRLLIVLAMLGIAPSLIGLAVRRRIAQPVLSVIASAALHVLVAVTLVLSLEALSGVYFAIHDALNVLAACVVISVLVRHALSARLAREFGAQDVLAPWMRVAGALLMGVVFLTPSTLSAWSVGAWVLLCVFAFFELPAVRTRTAVRPLHLVVGVATASIVVVSASLVGSSRESTEFADSQESAIEIEAVRTIAGATGLVDGFPATPEATLTTDGAIVVTTIETKAVVSVLTLDADGEPIPLGLNDQLQVARDGAVRIRVTGAGANLSATAWLFSEPILVGNGVSNSDGVIDVTLEIPENAPDGYHTIQVRLTDVDGKSVSIALPVVVGGSMLDASA